MSGYRTDLAMEAYAQSAGALPGVNMQTSEEGGVRVTRVSVSQGEGARMLGKEPGEYITLETDELVRCEPHRLPELAELIADEISPLLKEIPENGEVLVVGLGNRYITPDALGPRTVERILVTRQLHSADIGRNLRAVCAFAPGVAGVTGVDALDVVGGLCSRVSPSAVIVVDALAARDAKRILSTVQISDAGIAPGSGVGNHRAGLSRKTLGIPVIAVGVPMVVYASTIAKDVLHSFISAMEDAAPPNGDVHKMLTAFGEQDLDALLTDIARQELGDLVVSPREVDEAVISSASAVALGINRALHQGLCAQDILALVS